MAGPWPRPNAKRLCELVLISPGRRITREKACEELFPDHAADLAGRALVKTLSMARASLIRLGGAAERLIQADRYSIWAAHDFADVDLDAHRASLECALSTPGGLARDLALCEALREDRPLLADEPSAEWAVLARDLLSSTRMEARLALARDRARGLGRAAPANVVHAWEACLRADPCCEEAAAGLVRLYGAQGRPSLLEATYRRCCEALQELGLRPSSVLETAYGESRCMAPPAHPISGRDVTATGPDELRVVSVICAEIATASGADFEPEELKDAVSSALAGLIGQVESLGGTITSASSTGLQAVFGAPVSHDDDPERAIRAAYRMQSCLVVGTGASLRIGVETGPAVVGQVGDLARYGAVGETLATAAHLALAAKVGSVLVGPVTQASAEAAFEWGPRQELDRPGYAKPLIATPLVRPRARPEPVAGRRRAWAAPLVGREVEMSALDAALQRAVTGDGEVVVVVGDPGLGKTRLVSECRKSFMAWVGAGSGRLPLWLEGRAASYVSWVPYGLYQQLFLSWVGVTVEDGAPVARPALARAMRAVFGEDVPTLPVLARLAGV
ncbi:MAG TPA: AAA family ATPase, partial [Acidimicrobiales bacterium]|nr:AAA family ATPase [Acidimicrobiales bacterium]